MFAYEHGQKHEASVLVYHPDRLGSLLREDFEPETVHRCYLSVKQTVGPEILKCLLFRYQSILIRHQNKRLTPVFTYTVIDETLLVDILSACK